MSAEFPTNVYAPRTKENRSGVIYEPLKTKRIYVEDVTKLDAEVVAIETELGLLAKGSSASLAEKIAGLKSLAGATADVITIKGNKVGINNADPTVDLDMPGNVTIGKLLLINAVTGNPEFDFRENGTTRCKTYYDVVNNRLTFQNNENNNQDALYFADHVTTTGNMTIGLKLIINGAGIKCDGLPVYLTNALAVAGGLAVGYFYRTGLDPDNLCVVHA